MCFSSGKWHVSLTAYISGFLECRVALSPTAHSVDTCGMLAVGQALWGYGGEQGLLEHHVTQRQLSYVSSGGRGHGSRRRKSGPRRERKGCQRAQLCRAAVEDVGVSGRHRGEFRLED